MRSDQLSNMNTPEYSPPTPEVLSPDMFGAVCLFITEVSKQHRKRLRARRQGQLLDKYLQEGIPVPALQRLQQSKCIDEANLIRVAKRLRSAYQEDVHNIAENIQDTKASARCFFQDILPAESAIQGQQAMDVFDAYCRVVDSKESVKPKKSRKRKTRSQ